VRIAPGRADGGGLHRPQRATARLGQRVGHRVDGRRQLPQGRARPGAATGLATSATAVRRGQVMTKALMA
jgi:hypothetical protein